MKSTRYFATALGHLSPELSTENVSYVNLSSSEQRLSCLGANPLHLIGSLRLLEPLIVR